MTVILAMRPGGAAAGVQFNRDVRPILSDNCYRCHGPDKKNVKAGLRLDTFELATKATEDGIFPVKPGSPEQSEILKRMRSHDEDEVMPPPDSPKKPTAEQIATLERWITEGAKYEGHWAYEAVRRPAVPVGEGGHPVDAFIQAGLRSKQMKASEDADRRTLLRRLSLDLTGLPPSVEESAAFLADGSADAFEKQVERLLASPHFGERMAVPWLDVVRFADTVGYHGDQNQRIFPYRDYVIGAFNKNKPFDQFTLEQLAGDLLPNPTAEQLTATGFNRLNMMTREGGAQPKEYLAKYAADRVRTVSAAWMGSTMACCECHDHKYDPFSARDFYSLAAFFSDIRQWGVYTDYRYTPNPDLVGYTNEHPFPPELEVQSEALTGRVTKSEAEIDGLAGKLYERLLAESALREGYAAWNTRMSNHLTAYPDGWKMAVPRIGPTFHGVTAKPASWQAVLLSGKIGVAQDKTPQSVAVDVEGFASGLAVAQVRLELLPHVAHGSKLGRAKVKQVVVKLEVSVVDETGRELSPCKIETATADRKTVGWNNGQPVAEVHNGWRTVTAEQHLPHVATYILKKPVYLAAGQKLRCNVVSGDVGCFRVSLSPLAEPERTAATRGALAASAGWESLSAAPVSLRSRLMRAWMLSANPVEDFLQQAQGHLAKIRGASGGKAWTMITEATAPVMTRVLARGNWQDETGEVVEPSVPVFLPQIPAAKTRATRADLARWLTSTGNPLTARTVVNRFWKQFYGTGISNVLDDLGAQGEWPVNPQLLDWLAAEFMTPSVRLPALPAASHAWDVKHMVRLMVTARAYRQVSRSTAAQREVDPENRLLGRMSPRRLDAEFVRDNVLAIAGTLQREIGGPSARPWQPPGYYLNLNFPTRDYRADNDERQYRRGLYMHWQRTFLHPMLANFDAPGREECTSDRTLSNTPQQALTLLNDPNFVSAAKDFARRVQPQATTPEGTIRAMYQLALNREPVATEVKSLKSFHEEQVAVWAADEKGARTFTEAPKGTATDAVSRMAADMAVARVVLNLHETLTRY